MTAVLAPLPAPGRDSRRCRAGPWRRAWRKLRRRRGAMFGLVVVVGFVVARAVRALDRAARSDRHELGRDPQGAERGALVRHRRDRPRRVLARRLGHARVAARRRRLGLDLAAARRADRPGRGLPRRLRRRADLARHRRLPRLPVPDPGDRAGRVPRPEPHQRDDRDRHLGDADLRPADARRR